MTVGPLGAANLTVAELKEFGNKAYQDGAYREAVTWFTDAIAIEPSNHMLYSNRSAADLNVAGGGRRDHAPGSTAVSPPAAPAAPPGAANLTVAELKEFGNKAYQDGAYREAVTWFTDAIAIEPSNHMLYSNRSAANLNVAGGLDEVLLLALLDAEKCITLKPSWFKGHSRKGDVLVAMGKFAQAAEAFRKSLALTSGSGKSLKKSIAACEAKLKAAAATAPQTPGQAEERRVQALLQEYERDFRDSHHPAGSSSSQGTSRDTSVGAASTVSSSTSSQSMEVASVSSPTLYASSCCHKFPPTEADITRP
eukprot:gene12423-19213_t